MLPVLSVVKLMLAFVAVIPLLRTPKRSAYPFPAEFPVRVCTLLSVDEWKTLTISVNWSFLIMAVELVLGFARIQTPNYFIY